MIAGAFCEMLYFGSLLIQIQHNMMNEFIEKSLNRIIKIFSFSLWSIAQKYDYVVSIFLLLVLLQKFILRRWQKVAYELLKA